MPWHFGREEVHRPPGRSFDVWVIDKVTLIDKLRSWAQQALENGVMIDPEDLLAVLDGTEDRDR